MCVIRNSAYFQAGNKIYFKISTQKTTGAAAASDSNSKLIRLRAEWITTWMMSASQQDGVCECARLLNGQVVAGLVLACHNLEPATLTLQT